MARIKARPAAAAFVLLAIVVVDALCGAAPSIAAGGARAAHGRWMDRSADAAAAGSVTGTPGADWLGDDGGFRTIGAVGGTVDALAVDDAYVYAAVGARLYVLTADTVAETVGVSPPVPEPMQDLVVMGDHAYAAGEAGHIYVFDVSDPRAPEPLGVVQLPGGGDLVMLASNGRDLFAGSIWCDPAAGPCGGDRRSSPGWQVRIWALDTTDPAQPVPVRELDGVCGPLAASGSHLYVWDWQVGLRAYEYRADLGFVETWKREASDFLYPVLVAARGSLLYVLRTGTGTSTFEVMDFETPRAPRSVARLQLSGQAEGLFVSDDRLHVVVGGTLYVYEMEGIGTRDPVFVHDLAYPSGAVARGPIVLVGGASLAVVDTDVDGAGPRVLGSARPGTWTHGIDVVGDIGYAAWCEYGLAILDLSGRPTEISRARPGDACVRDVAATEDLVVASASRDAEGATADMLVTFRVEARGRLVEAGRLDGLGAEPRHLVLRDGYAYAETGYEGTFYVFDVRNPEQPHLLSAAPLLAAPFDDGTYYGSDVFVDAALATVAVSRAGPIPGGGIVTMDVTDPAHPRRLGYFAGPRAAAVHVHAGRAYLAGDVGLVVVDLSDPTHPVELAHVAGVDDVRDLDGVGARIVVAAGRGIQLVDASEPNGPMVVNSTELGSSGRVADAVAVSSERALALAGTGTARDLVAIDISAWGRAVTSVRLAALGTVSDVAVHGAAAVVASWDTGLRRFDVGSPSAPRAVVALDHGWPAYDIALRDDRAYVNGGWQGGLRIVGVGGLALLDDLAAY